MFIDGTLVRGKLLVLVTLESPTGIEKILVPKKRKYVKIDRQFSCEMVKMGEFPC